ncbi:MAG: hypothetical protein AB1597_09460 [Chloroflexota bacterium]
MNLEKRIERLEQHTKYIFRHDDVKVLTNDELAAIITGDPDAKASDLTDADLKAIINKYEAEHPGSDFISQVRSARGEDTSLPELAKESIIEATFAKMGLDPDTVRAMARANNQSMAEVIAGELGMSYEDFQRALKMH